MTIQELFEAFKTEAFDKTETVDPSDSLDWDSLAIGFAVARGAGYTDAMFLSIYWSDYCHGCKTLEDVCAGYTPGMYDEDLV